MLETDIETKTDLLPFVSIVVPALNEQDNIGQCIDGVLRLDYPSEKVELIVVDNGSIDKTRTIARSLGAQVFEVKNVTVAALRNFGVTKSRGEYIAFLDADCIPPEGWLTEAVSFFDQNSETVVVGGILTLSQNNHCPWVEKYWINYLDSKFTLDFEYVDTLSSFCFVVKGEAFEFVSGFNEDLVTCEDYDLGYRLAEYGKIIINRKIKVIHLGNAKSLYAFWKRQVWQGRSNLHNIFMHNISLRELPSLIVPIIYVLALFCFLASLFFTDFQWFLLRIVSVSIVVCIPSIKAISYKGKNVYRFFTGYWILWSIYLLARGFGAIFPRIKQKREN